MDLSIRRVLEALAPGPATVGILANRYGMEVGEAEEALAAAVDEGFVEAVGPVAFGLTDGGLQAWRWASVPEGSRLEAQRATRALVGRDEALRRLDP